MRALARAFTSVVWMAALASSGFHAAGCSTAPRPDAEVARSVEAAERRRLAAIVLASADDELPVALPVAGRVEADAGPGAAPQPAAVVPSHATADRYFAPERSEAGQRAFTFSPDSERSVAGDPADDAGGRRGERRGGKPQVRVQLFRFSLFGRPVSFRGGIKNKHLMLGAKIEL
jgi:hypothetical protein